MTKPTCLLIAINMFSSVITCAQDQFEKDVLKTSGGELTITFIGHGSLKMNYTGKVIHIDPFGKVADYRKLPQADLILLTHEHQDHLDTKALEIIRRADTSLILTETCAKSLTGGMVMKNGDVKIIDGITIEATPAYNIVHRRSDGTPFHPQGIGNGYILTFGDTRIYVAGDTEDIPEMKSLKAIDCAFLPMNLPYTMTPAMVANAVKSFRPKILYPYHYGDTKIAELQTLLKDETGLEVRIRKLQ